MNHPILSMMLLAPMLALAQNNGVGGGNLCREEIEKHRVQIEAWISRDEARGLDFSKALVKGWTYDDPAPAKSYKRAMLEVLKPGKVIVNCYDDLEKLNAIVSAYSGLTHAQTVGSGCFNYEDHGQWNIACYSKTINDEAVRVKQDKDIDGNYRLIHHEYASIAGVEKRMGVNQSDFSISNQLARFQYDEVVKVLGPEKEDEAELKGQYGLLAEKFNSAGSVTLEDLKGEYVGVCLNQKDKQNVAYMSTRMVKNVSRADTGGPLFPRAEPQPTWRHAYLMERTSGTLSKSSFDQFWWEVKQAVPRYDVSPLEEKDGVVIGFSKNVGGSSYRFETKKGQDGYYYGRRWASGYSSDPLKIDAYCYFYRKLF